MSVWNTLGNIYGTVWAVNILKSGFGGKPLKNFGMPGVPKMTKKQYIVKKRLKKNGLLLR